MENEIWKDIQNYEGYYQVSNLGNVRSMPRKVKHPLYGTANRKGKIMTPVKDKCGYLNLFLHKNGVFKFHSIHRLVANAFLLNKDNKGDVNHKNGNKTDNKIENLEWCTRSENVIHSFKNGLSKPKKGEQNSKSKLTDSQAKKIKYEHKDLNYSQIAKIYGIDPSSVGLIRRNKNWKHI